VKGLTLGRLAVAMALMAAAAVAQSQQPPPPASNPPSESSAATPTETPTADKPAAEKPAGPSAETLKKAKELGMHPETHSGVTKYCWEDESIGSCFKTKKCATEADLDGIIDSRQAMKNQMKNGSGTSNH